MPQKELYYIPTEAGMKAHPTKSWLLLDYRVLSFLQKRPKSGLSPFQIQRLLRREWSTFADRKDVAEALRLLKKKGFIKQIR